MLSGAQVQELIVLLTMKNGLSGPAAAATRSIRGMEAGAIGAAGGVARAETSVGLLGRSTTGAGQAIGHLGGVVGGVVRSVGLLGGTFAILGGAGAIGGAVKSALTFQQQMLLIKTQAGASTAELNSMTAAVMKLAPAVGVGPNELALALFHIESVGLRGATALDVLKISAQGARVGIASVEDVSNALAAAMRSSIAGTETAGKAMGTLNAIIGAGNLRMQQLTGALGTGILSSARAFGLTLTDVGAALAVLTDQGVSAEMAGTRLRTAFAQMGAPTAKARKELKLFGLDAQQLAKDMRQPNGLMFALQDLYKHLAEHGGVFAAGSKNAAGKDVSGQLTTTGSAAITASFGGARTGVAILTLLNSLSLLQQKYTTIGQLSGKFGEQVASTAETAAFKFHRLQASLETLGIAMGNVLLPAFASIADTAATFFTQNTDGIVGGLNAAAGAAKILFDALGAAATVLGTIVKIVPPAGSALQLLLGAALIGKTSSILFGKNPFTWAVGSVLGRLGIGGKAGAALGGAIGGGTPVFVTNWPIGLGAGGGVAGAGSGAAGAAETGGAGLLLGTALPLAVIGASIVAPIASAMIISNANTNRSINVQQQANAWLAKNPTRADLTSGLAAVTHGINEIRSNPLSVLVQGDALQHLEQIRTDIQAQLRTVRAGGVPVGSTIGTPGRYVAIRDLRAAMGGSGSDSFNADRLAQMTLAKGGGSVLTLQSILSVLKTQETRALKKGDMLAVKLLTGDINAITSRLGSVIKTRLAAADSQFHQHYLDSAGAGNPILPLARNKRDQMQPDVVAAIHRTSDSQNRHIAEMKNRIGDLNRTTQSGLFRVANDIISSNSTIYGAVMAVVAAVQAIPQPIVNVSPRSIEYATGQAHGYGPTASQAGALPSAGR